jgi:predicted DNA-binding antitoxin AbrB/MazE fold protein
MNQRMDAIFENGVFRPAIPVDIPDGEHVSLNVETHHDPANDLSDVKDLLDVEFMESCRQHAGRALSLEEVQRTLSAFTGSLADRISKERDER